MAVLRTYSTSMTARDMGVGESTPHDTTSRRVGAHVRGVGRLGRVGRGSRIQFPSLKETFYRNTGTSIRENHIGTAIETLFGLFFLYVLFFQHSGKHTLHVLELEI